MISHSCGAKKLYWIAKVGGFFWFCPVCEKPKSDHLKAVPCSLNPKYEEMLLRQYYPVHKPINWHEVILMHLNKNEFPSLHSPIFMREEELKNRAALIKEVSKRFPGIDIVSLLRHLVDPTISRIIERIRTTDNLLASMKKPLERWSSTEIMAIIKPPRPHALCPYTPNTGVFISDILYHGRAQ